MESKKKQDAILVSDKMDFKPTKIKRDKEGHHIMVKGSIHQAELMILNIYTPNTGAPRYIKQVLNDLQRLRFPHNNSGSLLHSTVNSRQINQTENLQGYPGLELRSGPRGPNRHLQNSPPQTHRIYIILSTALDLL